LTTVRAIPDRLVYVMRHGIRTNKHLSFETAKSGLGKDCQGKGSFCCGTGTPSHRQGTRPWAKTKRVNHQGKYPNLVLVHGPVHASWLNQIEIYFSIIQRKVLTPNNFSSRQEVADRLLAFEAFHATRSHSIASETGPPRGPGSLENT